MTRTLISIALVMLVALTGCKQKDEPESRIPSDAAYDFVTVEASDSHGCLLTLRKVDDEPLVQYTSGFDLASSSTHVSVGDRVIICYKPVGHAVYTSGRINLYGYAKLDNSDQSVLIPEGGIPQSWTANPVQVQSIWRTGQFINMQAKVFVHTAVRPESFTLSVDPMSLDQEIVPLYLSYVNREGNDGENPLGVNASFDISEVWDRPGCRGVVVMVPGRSDLEYYSFEKTSVDQ